MYCRYLLPLLAAVFLSGCSDADWRGTMTGLGVADVAPDPQPLWAAGSGVAAPAPMPVADKGGFCQAVAHHDASDDDFDTATRQRVYERSYQQCVALYSNPPSAPGPGTR